MFVLAVVAPWRYVMPAYAPPFVTGLPPEAKPVNGRLGAWAEVLGYSMSPAVARPGDRVRVRVFLRSTGVPRFNYYLVTRLYGRNERLIERVEESIDPKKAAELAGKMAKNEFSLADYRDQLKQVRKMGKIGDLVRMIPGVPKVKEVDMAHGEGEMKKFVAILDSMTNQERERPEIISGPRRKRMAMGSGTKVEDVNRLLKQYEQTRKMMKLMSAQSAKGSKLRKLASRLGIPWL